MNEITTPNEASYSYRQSSNGHISGPSATITLTDYSKIEENTGTYIR